MLKVYKKRKSKDYFYDKPKHDNKRFYVRDNNNILKCYRFEK